MTKISFVLFLCFFNKIICESFAQKSKYKFTTLAGGSIDGYKDGKGLDALFNAPEGIAMDKLGNIYTTEYRNSVIRKITKEGIVTTLAGKDTTRGFNDGKGPDARFNRPHGLTVDSDFNIYVVESKSNTIRKVDQAGNVKTIAGTGGTIGFTDGIGGQARFNMPEDIAINSKGILYVADTYNYTIRQITPDGMVSTHAGKAMESGNTDGILSQARFNRPIGLAIDDFDNIYVVDADYDNPEHGNCTIRKITPNGIVSTLAGFSGKKGNNDGKGKLARFNRPVGITVSKEGIIFIADTEADTIRKIDKDGNVSTIGGKYLQEFKKDGIGSQARFNDPQAIDIDADGTIYIADTLNHRIVKGEVVK